MNRWRIVAKRGTAWPQALLGPSRDHTSRRSRRRQRGRRSLSPWGRVANNCPRGGLAITWRSRGTRQEGPSTGPHEGQGRLLGLSESGTLGMLGSELVQAGSFRSVGQERRPRKGAEEMVEEQADAVAGKGMKPKRAGETPRQQMRKAKATRRRHGDAQPSWLRMRHPRQPRGGSVQQLWCHKPAGPRDGYPGGRER